MERSFSVSQEVGKNDDPGRMGEGFGPEGLFEGKRMELRGFGEGHGEGVDW